MADIKAPLTAAMKTRAKAAIDQHFAERDEPGEPDYTGWTPRKLRALILSLDDSDEVRADMREEGWFESSDPATETLDDSGFRASSTKVVKVA